MPAKSDNSKYILYGVVGLLVLGGIALLVTQSSSSTNVPAGSTQAFNSIVASNETAQTLQASLQGKGMDDATAIEQSVISANTAIKLAANNNATSLSIAKGSNTLALNEANISASVTKQQAADAEAISINQDVAQTGIAETLANDAATANIGVANANAGAVKAEASDAENAANTKSNDGLWGSILGAVTSIVPFFSGFGATGSGSATVPTTNSGSLNDTFFGLALPVATPTAPTNYPT